MKNTIGKTIGALFATMALATTTVAPQEASAYIDNPNADSHVVYYIPHQDDEALTFGVSIMNHVMGGHNVHVVLMTDGSASAVRTKLGMEESEFTAARNREFEKSLSIFGVEPENIAYEPVKDGTLTVTQASDVIRKYEAKYPQAKHKTFSYTDFHNDHKNVGLALKRLYNAGLVSDARYYVRRGDNPTGLTLSKEYYNPAYKNYYLAVSTAYAIENPRLGLYGIGHKSVSESFQLFEEQPLSRFHK